MLRKLSYSLFLALSLLASQSVNASETGPQELVEQTTTEVLDTLAKRRAELEKDKDLVYKLTNEIVVPHLDLVAISKWVLAKNWRTASKEQKLRFIRAFKDMMIRTYAVAILDYDKQKLKYVPLRDDPANGDVTVRAEYIESGKAPVTINYRLHKRQNGWKVYDVTIDGVSIVATYRTSFGTEIRQTSLDALIERIEKKNNS